MQSLLCLHLYTERLYYSQKASLMKSKVFYSLTIVFISITCFIVKKISNQKKLAEPCVFNTVFGERPLDHSQTLKSGENVDIAIQSGLTWLIQAQHPEGGWGAGFHSNQLEMDPHQVPADPATTAMVAMALLRSGSNLDTGVYSDPLNKATEYILTCMEQAAPNGKITDLNGTQIQRKLGDNIDLVLASQYLTNLLEHIAEEDKRYQRIFHAINKGVDMTQTQMDSDGKSTGAGWAGVLQSAFATNFLESAEAKGAWVDKEILKKAKQYQTNNYDTSSDNIKTRDGAGIVLYSVSGSVRANAKEARKARDLVKQAYADKKIETEVISYNNLSRLDMPEEEAMLLVTANEVYQSAKTKAQQKDVVSGFGNNGGEEFLSFLQTGESLVINDDDTWNQWYNTVSGNLLSIQNNDGSWHGHHCITSPVFCTATCLMVLSIQNDIDHLKSIGE